jgi:hypothetical protein
MERVCIKCLYLNDEFDLEKHPHHCSKCGWGYGRQLESATDNVNHPEHYTAGSVECIEAIKAALTPEEFRGYCKGSIIKYVWRERMKGGDESLAKGQWYLNLLVE